MWFGSAADEIYIFVGIGGIVRDFLCLNVERRRLERIICLKIQLESRKIRGETKNQINYRLNIHENVHSIDTHLNLGRKTNFSAMIKQFICFLNQNVIKNNYATAQRNLIFSKEKFSISLSWNSNKELLSELLFIKLPASKKEKNHIEAFCLSLHRAFCASSQTKSILYCDGCWHKSLLEKNGRKESFLYLKVTQ